MSEPVIHLGKSGVTDSLIEEIKVQLKKNKKIKVKMLKSARKDKGRRELAEEVALRSKSKLVDLRGNTFILSKER